MTAALQMSTQSAPSLPEASSQTELLGDLAELAWRLDELQQSSLEETAAVRLTAELTHIVQRALSTVIALERLDSAEQSARASEQDWEPQTWVGVRTTTATAPRLGDVCFACSFELNVALRALERARDTDEQLSAAESARRKLYRAIHAVLRLSPNAAAARASLEKRIGNELTASLAVRRLYAEFRHNLRRAENESSEAVLTALRYAAGALAALTASPHYHAVRVSDAALLRSQHARLLEWSRSGKPRAAGLQLLDDLSTSASLLRDINRRQELRAHDTDLIRALLATPPLDRTDWLTQLDPLIGLDDALDRLTAQLRAARGNELAVEILARLSSLA
jgi:hypothetical protein